jgi:hypothetical protein
MKQEKTSLLSKRPRHQSLKRNKDFFMVNPLQQTVFSPSRGRYDKKFGK